ncbi:MAG: single-stranded DNA-binding protein [Anaerolineales bacterium]|nr:single-stranded DNA-binding protein [Anaerolineales bacterium]
MSYQSTLIVGFLGRDPEMDYTASGQARTRFSVATNRKFKNAAGEELKETAWFNVTAWGKQAEACNAYLHKGSLVLVEGRLVPDPETGGPHIWTRQGGSPAASFEISAETVRFLNTRNGNGEADATPAEEIPF